MSHLKEWYRSNNLDSKVEIKRERKKGQINKTKTEISIFV